MKLSHALLAFLCCYGLKIGAQVNDSANDNDFSVKVAAHELIEEGYYKSRVSFVVPTTSDEVLLTNAVSCDGWIPKGANIDMVRVTGIKGLPEGSSWTCVSKNCSWRSGVTGSVILKTEEPLTDQKHPITVEIEGLGSMWGLSKWYKCVVELEL